MANEIIEVWRDRGVKRRRAEIAEENARTLQKVDEDIASWPSWKQKLAEDDSEFFASYRYQMCNPVDPEELDK